MKSRITIEIDYANSNQPVIQIIRKTSEDVRDGLIQSFIQSLGGSSIFCFIECAQTHMPNHTFDHDAYERWFIRPVPANQLKGFAEKATSYCAHVESLMPKESI